MNAVVLEAGAGERILAGPSVNRVLVGGDDTGGRLSAIEMEIGSGFGGPPPHVHGELDHVWYVLAGQVRLTVGDVVGEFTEGACLFVPAGVAHAFANPFDVATRILEVDSPRALDGYFRDLAAAFPPGTPVDPAAVGRIMARHDTRPVGS